MTILAYISGILLGISIAGIIYLKTIDKEIERLKEMKLHTEKYASEMEDKYILEKSKNDKAIEYIEQQDTKTHRLDTRLKRVSKILQGVDKE